MKKLLCIAAAVMLVSFITVNPGKDYTGFTGVSAKAQHELEARYDSLLKTSDVDFFIKYLSAHPHHLGSAQDKANKEFILQKYRDWGYDAHIDTFYALFPTPKTRVLEAIGIPYKATLQEMPLKEDATSSQTSEQLPTYNAYSADGDVTGELVYVNQGVSADYEQLDRMGIDVKGKIVIVRYGGSFRGVKPRLAQEHGAIGCIIYSDPKDDGYYQGDVYPTGAYKNEYGVQRGSVLNMAQYPGDPQTPGYASTKNAKRIDIKSATNLVKIPVLPISYHDAKPLLAAITGPVAPENWRGALPITYHIGPGPLKVHLKLEFNWNMVPVYDVIAMMKGSTEPDEWVIRGNHEDAWVNGANDPISSQAAMLTEAQAIGQLVKDGLRPKRTMVFCSWDGEEEGMFGSVEWAEANATELQQKAIAYINSDGNGRGFLGVGGSHALQTFANEVAQDVPDPEMGISVLERKRASDAVNASSDKERKEILADPYIKIGALGSGSDYTAFLQHLGIASFDLGYGGENGGGEYHSIYDSYDMYRRFKDPGFQYGVALAKTAGRMELRLLNADVLPFNFKDFYSTVNGYLDEIIKKTDEMRTSTEMDNKLIKNNYFVYANDPTKTFVPPATQENVPYLDFSPLQNALAALKVSSEKYESVSTNASTTLSGSALDQLNVLLYQSERKLLLDNGLPNRPWFKNAIYAPGYNTGYSTKTLPAVREAIENRDWQLAQKEIGETTQVITAYSKQIDNAVQLLSKSSN